MTDELGIIYLVFCLMPLLIIFAASGSFGGGVWSAMAVAFALLAALLIMALNWLDYVVFPAFTRLLGVEFRLAKDYTITKSQDAIVKNINGLNYAVGYLTANIFAYVFKAEAMEEDMEQKISDSPETWERAVMAIDFPFKFHVLSNNRDVQKARDLLEGKRSYQEFQMNRAVQGGKTSDTELAELRRKENMIETQLNRIAEGEKPISTVMYIETVAVGVTQKAALDNLASQVNRLQIALSSLDLQLQRVVGRELGTLFNFNFSLPVTQEQASSYFDSQG
jgi:hypothetical protein